MLLLFLCLLGENLIIERTDNKKKKGKITFPFKMKPQTRTLKNKSKSQKNRNLTKIKSVGICIIYRKKNILLKFVVVAVAVIADFVRVV